MANFFGMFKPNQKQLSDEEKKKRKIVSGARKFIIGLKILPIAIKIGLIFVTVTIVAGLVYSMLHWKTDMDSSQNNPDTLYDMIGAGDQNINELISIAGNEEDGYYIAFKEGVETRLKEIIDKYADANTQGIKDYNPEDGEAVLSQDILLQMIKAELYTQYPNLGGKVGKESNVALLQDTKERYNQGIMQIPNIYQTDEESEHACVAMVLSYLKDESVTEEDVIKWGSQDKYKGDYFRGEDGVLKYFEESAKEWDVGDIMQIKSEQTVKDALKLGRPVIAYVNERTNNYFTKSKQYIVLTGIDDDGNVYVNNPNQNRQEGKFDFDKVIGTIVETYYIYHSKQGVDELKEAPDTKTKASNTRTATSITRKTNNNTNSSNNDSSNSSNANNNANNNNSNNNTSNSNTSNNNTSNNSNSQVKDLEGFLFVGDSITVGMESVVDSGVKCKAVVGVGSKYWLDNFGELTGLADIKGINVFLGANDYSYGIDYFKQLLDKLHDEYKDAKIYVNKLLPDLQPTADTASREKYMSDVEAYCKEKSYLTYIDATDGIQLASDGLHPAGQGEYKKLYENIKKAITENGDDTSDTSSSPVTTSENVKKARMFIAEDTGKGLDGFQGSVRIRRVTPNKELGKIQKVKTGETTITETTSGESGGQINSYIEQNITDGTWAVYAQNLSTNSELVNIDADKQFQSASLIKLFIMAEAYQEMETDSTKQYDKTLIEKMIEESDNDATNTLIDQIGMDKINQYIKDHGYDKTYLNRKMLQSSANGDNYTSAKDVAKILKEIYDGKCVSQQASSEMLGYLKNQKNRSKIPAGISDNVEVANKTGELSNVQSDAAIVLKDGAPYVLVVISTGISDTNVAINNIIEISKRVYEKVNSGDSSLESSETNTKVSTTLESRIYDLKFMPEEKFDEWIESPDVDQKILEYYTLDKNWNIITAKWSYSSDDGLKFTKNTAVNYTNVIAKYTTPFEYLLDFYINIKDEAFILNFIKLAMNSQIVIAIQDNVTSTETTVTTTLEYDDGIIEDEGTTVKMAESVSTKVELTYADTWYVNVEKPSYPKELQGEKGWVDNVITLVPGKQKETTNTSTSTETGPSKQVEETVKVDENVRRTTIRNIGSTITTTTSTYSISCTYEKEDEKVELKEKDFINLFDSNDVARNRLKDIWLLRMIENGKKTANFTDLTKYLLYQITHNELYGDISRESLISKYKNNDFKSLGRLRGANIQEKVWIALRTAGFTAYAAAGVMGNIDYESGGFNPEAIEGGSGEGIGLCQWSFGRKTQLIAYAESKGKDWRDEDLQVEFLMMELDESGDRTYTDYQIIEGHGFVTTDWTDAEDAKSAAEAFCWLFERPNARSCLCKYGRKKKESTVLL